jgi:hypothetical protein
MVNMFGDIPSPANARTNGARYLSSWWFNLLLSTLASPQLYRERFKWKGGYPSALLTKCFVVDILAERSMKKQECS